MDIWSTYKTKQCKNIRRKGECSNKDCTFWHNLKDRRRHPSRGYLGILCLEAITSDCCNHEDCHFCKNLTEFTYHNDNYKKFECIFRRLNIQCERPLTCPYFHEAQERRESNIQLEYIKEESKIPKIVPPDPNYYTIKQVISNFEDKNNEFKHILSKNFNPPNIVKTIVPYISAFLNTEGGTIYYGIQDNGTVSGIQLPRDVRDAFLLQLDGEIGRFTPHLSVDKYSVKFVGVANLNGSPIENQYVIEIHINKGEDNVLYFTGKNEAFIRRNASITMLTGQSLINFYEYKKKNLTGN